MKNPKLFQNLRIILFVAVLVAGCVLGLILPLRPAYSDSENRDLTEFPTFTWDAFLDGSYTTDIGLWYSDTFPYREQLIALNTRLRGLYGIKSLSASSGGQGDAIDTGGDFVWETIEDTLPGETDSLSSETEPENPGHEIIKGYLVDGIHGYELYYFNRDNSDKYARLVVQTALKVDGKAQVYAMVTPMSYAFGVDEKTQTELNVSNCRDSIDWMYHAIAEYGKSAGLANPVKTVDAYGAIEAHADEYVFFRTDHHWTALGAHYASRAFLDMTDRAYPALADYTQLDFKGFTGSLAGHTKHENPALVNNPDTIHAYVSPALNTVTLTPREGDPFEAPIVNSDAEKVYSASGRYRCFTDGDHPLSVAHNPAVGDGSAILLIKESYGNALFPMLVDSYEYVYAVDYRFYRATSIEELVDTYGIDTILFVNNPVATSADYNMSCLTTLVNKKP